MATDPVCGMTVKESEAAGQAVHAGETYYFCSARCLNEFSANPMAHVHAPHEAVPLKMAVGQSHVHAPGMAAAAPKSKSAKESLPVAMVDGRRIGTGRGGPITGRLNRAFRQLVRKECHGPTTRRSRR